MSRQGRWRRRAARTALTMAALAVLPGVRTARAGDHPPAISPEPLGAAMHRIFAAQAAAAGQDHFVFYELEWLKNSTTLGPAGRIHLDRVVRYLSQTRYPVIIEPNPDSALNVA